MAPTESTPLVAAQREAARGDLAKKVSSTCLLGGTMVILSLGLINLNKWLMKADNFPHAIPLVLFHMGFCSVVSLILYAFVPSWYPSLTEADANKRVTVDADFMLRGALPIAVLFAASMVLTNLAYTRLSLAFVQMLKESNLIWVYLLSLATAMEAFSWRHAQVIGVALFAMGISVRGELHFVASGFLVQLSSVWCECLRIVLQGVMLQGKKVDALTYVMIVSPLSFALLAGCQGAVLCLPEALRPAALELPARAEVWRWLPALLASSCVAFGLNAAIALMIKYTSPMSYIMSQVAKDLLAVAAGVFFLAEAVSNVQRFSFLLQVGCVITWALLKLFPEKFEAGLVSGLVALVVGERDQRLEACKEEKQHV